MDILTVLRVVICLIGVVALIWFIQRKAGAGAKKRLGGVPITIAGRKPLGQKAALVVVDVAEQRYTLGVTETGITVLHSEAAPPQTFDEHLDAAEDGLTRPSFLDAVTSQLKPGSSRKGTK